MSKKPLPRKMRPYQPSMLYPGIVSAPSSSDLVSSYSCVRSKSDTEPRPSQRGHIPPTTLNVFFSAFWLPFFNEPTPVTDGTLKAKALGEPTCGWPSRLKRIRSMALASVAVPTVDRGSEPMRC